MAQDLQFFQTLDTDHPVDLLLGAEAANRFDLTFFQPLDTSHPVDLIFGHDADAPADVTTISFAITLAVSAQFQLRDETTVEFSVAIPPPFLSMVLDFDNAVARGLRASVKAPWQQATPKPRFVSTPYDNATRLPTARQASWTKATRLDADTGDRWHETDKTKRPQRSARWQEGRRRSGAPTGTRWQETDKTKRPQRTTHWQEATPLPAAPRETRWQETTRTSRPLHTAPWGEGSPLSRMLQAAAGPGKTVYADTEAPWQEGRKPPPGRSVFLPPEPPEVVPCYIPPPGSAVPLLFEFPWDGLADLYFICIPGVVGPPATVIVPIRKVYMVLNEASLTRVDDGTNIPTYSMSMSLDVDSWTWSFSASVPGAALTAVEPDTDGTPVEVEAMVNGVPYRFLIESIQRDRTFGKSRLSLGGRGKSALLDIPSLNFYNTTDRTAQQLMADVLTDNGVPLPWTVDWNLDDWLVPAGVFSHSGSYISALNAIAAAAGAYIQPHNTDQELSVNLRYPTAPWDWAGITPDYQLPSSVTTRESISWEERARHNRVWISGEGGSGRLVRVTRLGSAGDVLAPMVTDPLITAAAAGRQRGISILADTGRVATVGLRLPVLDDTGIIPPGKMVRYVDGGDIKLGITRSVNVDISMPTVWQSITVETHNP